MTRLETAASELAAEGESIALAFSGGISSHVLTALLRKRADLECLVAGVADAADVAVAEEERLYLDYRVTVIRLSPSRVLSLARAVARRFSAMPAREVLDAVPLEAVGGRVRGRTFVAGFGASALPCTMTAFLSDARAGLPLAGIAGPVPPTRARLVAVARSLAVPESFASVPARSPGQGSGAGPLLRAMALERGVPLAAFLRPAPRRSPWLASVSAPRESLTTNYKYSPGESCRLPPS